MVILKGFCLFASILFSLTSASPKVNCHSDDDCRFVHANAGVSCDSFSSCVCEMSRGKSVCTPIATRSLETSTHNLRRESESQVYSTDEIRYYNSSMISSTHRRTGEGYPFPVSSLLSMYGPEVNKAQDPNVFEFHMTRSRFTRFIGCAQTEESYPYSHVLPLLRDFDLIVTRCEGGGNWDICVYATTNEMTTKPPTDRTLKVHVLSDWPPHKYLIDNLLPFFDTRLKSTGQGVLLYSGSGDNSESGTTADEILKSKAIVRWAVEQNHLKQLHDNHPHIVEVPCGICYRENTLSNGYRLRVAMAESRENFTHPQVEVPPPFADRTINFSPPITEVLNRTAEGFILKARSKKFSERYDRVYFCHGHSDTRTPFLNWATNNCTICDVCPPPGSLSNINLWREYGKYKFVFSPWGNGFDCGRTTEIMLMGAIPIIKYFAGTNGYASAGLEIETVENPEEFDEENLRKWIAKHNKENPLELLTHEFWKNRIFGTLA